MDYDPSFLSCDADIAGSESKCSIEEVLADGLVEFFYIKADEV